MFWSLETIVLFLIFGNSVDDCSEVIRNYTNVKAINDKSCGISLFSSKPKLCFKYHNDLLLNLKDSRNAIPGEAPWSLFIDRMRKIRKAPIRAFLNPLSREDYWNGTEYMSTGEKHVHPKFVFNVTNAGMAYDIGLFKLDKPIGMKPGFVNPICLPPERNFSYIEEQYAMVSGWIYEWYENTNLIPLQIGTIKVSSHTNVMLRNDNAADVVNDSFIWPGYIFGKKIRTKVCRGDSGSPVWQYYHGRAVLIGLLSDTVKDKIKDGCQYENYTGYFTNKTVVEYVNETQIWITWIPMMMDWVISVIINDTQN